MAFCAVKRQDLLRGMLRKDPSKRLTVAAVLSHPWIATPVPVSPQQPDDLDDAELDLAEQAHLADAARRAIQEAKFAASEAERAAAAAKMAEDNAARALAAVKVAAAATPRTAAIPWATSPLDGDDGPPFHPISRSGSNTSERPASPKLAAVTPRVSTSRRWTSGTFKNLLGRRASIDGGGDGGDGRGRGRDGAGAGGGGKPAPPSLSARRQQQKIKRSASVDSRQDGATVAEIHQDREWSSGGHHRTWSADDSNLGVGKMEEAAPNDGPPSPVPAVAQSGGGGGASAGGDGSARGSEDGAEVGGVFAATAESASQGLLAVRRRTLRRSQSTGDDEGSTADGRVGKGSTAQRTQRPISSKTLKRAVTLGSDPPAAADGGSEDGAGGVGERAGRRHRATDGSSPSALAGAAPASSVSSLTAAAPPIGQSMSFDVKVAPPAVPATSGFEEEQEGGADGATSQPPQPAKAVDGKPDALDTPGGSGKTLERGTSALLPTLSTAPTRSMSSIKDDDDDDDVEPPSAGSGRSPAPPSPREETEPPLSPEAAPVSSAAPAATPAVGAVAAEVTGALRGHQDRSSDSLSSGRAPSSEPSSEPSSATPAGLPEQRPEDSETAAAAAEEEEEEEEQPETPSVNKLVAAFLERSRKKPARPEPRRAVPRKLGAVAALVSAKEKPLSAGEDGEDREESSRVPEPAVAGKSPEARDGEGEGQQSTAEVKRQDPADAEESVVGVSRILMTPGFGLHGCCYLMASRVPARL